MYTLWAIHVVHFASQPTIYDAKPVAPSARDVDDNFERQEEADKEAGEVASKKIGSMMISPSSSMQTISFSAHYILMDRVFVHNHDFIWIFASLANVACFIAFLCIQGTELAYSLYIPLDFYLTVSMSAFYWYYYKVESDKKLNKERLEKRQERIREAGND